MNKFAAPIITLLGVPAGLALTGGNINTSISLSLAVVLALLAFPVRRWPLTLLIVSVLCVAAFRTADLIGSGWIWPATAALVALALAGRLLAAVITSASALLFGVNWDAFVALHHGPRWTLAHVGGEALVIALVLAVATAYRNTMLWRAEVARRLERDEHERELDARRRRAEERVDIARDLHDVVSHTLAVVGVHLNVALDAFDSDPQEARESLRVAQEVRGRAMTDVKALVDVLREGEPAAMSPAGGLDGLAELVDRVRSAGVEVVVGESGERGEVPAPVATAVYRVVQESLTNVVRHAGATRVTVTLRFDPAAVTVVVRDDGRGMAGPIVEGHGISGMRERVTTLGGTLTTDGTDGFQVSATIPATP